MPTIAELQQLATTIAIREGIDADLFVRQIQAESSFRPDCVTGPCVGLGQIHTRYAREFITRFMLPEDDAAELTEERIRELLFTPEFNLTLSARLMHHYLRGNDWASALVAYNAGPGALLKCQANYGPAWMAHIPDESKLYIGRILLNLRV